MRGGYKGKTYLNSQETFSYYYSLGHRIFEYDLELSVDNKLIGTHSFDNFENSDYLIKNGILYEDFKQIKLYNTYTPINEEWLLETLIEYPDVRLVIDTKSDFLPIYNRLIELANEYNIDIST